MEFSKYQLAVFDWIENSFIMDRSDQFGSVDSVAGSGKTYTGVKGLEKAPASAYKLFTCFDNNTKVSLAEKTTHIQRCKVMNYNGTGWSACMNAMRTNPPTLQKDKTARILRYVVMFPNVRGDLDFQQDAMLRKVSRPIERLVSLFKGMCCYSVEAAEAVLPALLEFHDFDLPEEDDPQIPYSKFLEYLFKTYKVSIESTNYMDFDDQIFQPLMRDWRFWQNDFVMVDEFQDTNLMQYNLVERILRPNGRMMVFGDDDQVIYEFRGSMPDTMKNWREKKGAKYLPLSICYRCPKAVVELARQIVPRMEAAPNAEQGIVEWINKDKLMEIVKDGDFVLCRTTAPLIGLVCRLTAKGIKATVRGKDVGEHLTYFTGLVLNWSRVSPDCTIDVFRDALQEYVSYRTERLKKAGKESKIEQLNDSADMLRAFFDSENCPVETLPQLRKQVAKTFDDDQKSGVQAMTSHKSKGLQAHNVFVLEPQQLEDGWRATKEWMRGSQRRLRYVTHTRAQHALRFVQSDKKRKRDE